jgi:hypothetical protein
MSSPPRGNVTAGPATAAERSDGVELDNKVPGKITAF